MEISIPSTSSGGTGANWLNGAGTPDGGIGSVGDYYVESVTGAVYKKTGALTWTDQGFSLKGEAGSGGTPQKAFASKLTQYARSRVCRVAHYGTSIAAGSNSGSRRFCAALQSQLGDANNNHLNMAALGGSYSAAYNGWYKQPYCGNFTVRVRGESTSAVLVLVKYARRFIIHYSTEVGGSTCDVHLDGVYYGTINCGGSQSVGNEFVVEVGDDPIYAKLEIMPPASGYVYLERYSWCLDDNGVDILDYSLGGSALANYKVASIVSAPMVDAIPITGDTGLNGSFLNEGPYSKPDLLVIAYVVNDAGATLELIQSGYVPSINRIVEWSYDNEVQVVFILEMGGHFSLPIDNRHAEFNYIRNHLLSKDAWPHVTVVDWHTLSGMSTTDYTQLETLTARYYGVTGLDAELGTYTGDFIHPKDAGHAILTEALTKAAGILPDGHQSYDPLSARYTGRLNNIPSSSTWDYDLANAVGYTAYVENNMGVTMKASILGPSINLLTGLEEPCWINPDEMNLQYVWSGMITDAGTEDKYGKYKLANSTLGYIFPPVSNTGADPMPNRTVLILARGTFPAITPVSGAVRNTGWDYESNYRIQGQEVDNSGGQPLVGGSQFHLLERPRLYHFTVSGSTYRPDYLDYLSLSGYIYKVWVTATDYPCVAGKSYLTTKGITVPLTVSDDIPVPEAIIGQTYYETVDGIEIEKTCIATNVMKPLQSSVTMYGLYRIQNRTVPRIERAYLNGTITMGAYSSDLGGLPRTTTSNPTLFITSTSSRFYAADAEKWFTAVGKMILDAGAYGPTLMIQMYASSTNTTYYLNSDGLTWVIGSYTLEANNMLYYTKRGFGTNIGVTFKLPTAAQMGASSWQIRIWPGATGTTNHGGDWFVCQGKSACV